MAAAYRLDVLILGGGAAGLWLLDDLHRLGYSVALAEAGSLGSGQTIASQGIIHGGLKYALHGHAGKAARAIRGMPLRGDDPWLANGPLIWPRLAAELNTARSGPSRGFDPAWGSLVPRWA